MRTLASRWTWEPLRVACPHSAEGRKLTFLLAPSLAVICLSCSGIFSRRNQFLLGSGPQPRGHLVSEKQRGVKAQREEERGVDGIFSVRL